MTDFHRILKTLADANVDFIVVGGVAAVLQGAPIHTKDLDILYSLEPANQARLLGALQELGAVFRDDPRRIAPNLSHLASLGHKLLTTSAGKLDCLGTIEEHTTYEDILDHVEWMQVDEMRIRVISLPRLIQVKEKLTRPKDQLALLQLRATLEEREAKKR